MLTQATAVTLNSFPNYFKHCHFNVSTVNEAMIMNTRLSRERYIRMTGSASKGQNSGIYFEKKRKVVEHICLLKAKKDLSDEEENDMLDYLYTSQYQMGGIVAISLGRISNQNVENYTHAVFMRFQKKEYLAKFYENPFYSKILKEHVTPYCHELINVDYESEVEDDILPIFRKGEEFNFGEEFMLLIEFSESAFGDPVEDALASFKMLIPKFPSLIVQSTQGYNLHSKSVEYTHGIVIRFRSFEAYESFVGSSEYKDGNNMNSSSSLFGFKKQSNHRCCVRVSTMIAGFIFPGYSEQKSEANCM